MAQKRDFPTERRGASVPVQEQSRTDRGTMGESGAAALHREQNGADIYENEREHGGQVDSVSRVVARYPYPSVLTSFGLGFGLGLAVTLLVYRRQPSWFERNVPESIQHFPDRLKHVPETIGSYVPSSWKSW